MSGSKELTVEERWAEIEVLLEDYKKKLCIKVQMNPQVEEILNLREIQLKTLDNQTANSYAYLLMQHSLFIQNEYNSHSSKNLWARHNLDIVIGVLASNYGGKFTKWEEKKALIIKDNTHAKVLNDFIKETESRMETLNFLSRKIEIMASILKRREYES